MDVTEIGAEERQAIMWELPLDELEAIMRKLLVNDRKWEMAVRMDAMAIYIMRACKHSA